jgi:predicted ATPase
LALVTIAQSLGIQSTTGDIQAEIATYLHRREFLLLLDNFEHLLEAADMVAYLLQNAPRLKVLVTSRERLYLREEWLLPIAGLSVAEGLVGEAGQLFVRSAQRVQPGFTGREQEQAIAAICRQVEGMPLGLELAASWVRVMSCGEIARQIAYNSAFLTTSLRNLPERHRSLRNLFDQSWRLLSPLEQGVLMRLSVFAGGWLLEEAATVTGATLALLLDLVDKSLVRVNGQNRFDLHELVRQYAAEQLVAGGEYDLIRQRHYAAYLHLFRTADSHLRGAEAATWFARAEAEQDNLRSALQWMLDKARYEDAAWLMVAAQFFWHFRGHLVEGARWLAQLLPHRHILATDLRLAVFVAFYFVAGGLEEFQPLSRYADEVVQLLENCAYKVLRAAGSWWLVVAGTVSQGDAQEQAVALARAANEGPRLGAEFGPFADQDFMLSATLWAYANILIMQGELARAVPIAAESLRLFQARGSYTGIGDGIGTLGMLALLQGDLAQAHSRFSEVVTLATAHSSRMMLVEWQPLLGIVTLYRGDAVEARRLLSESLRLCLDLKDKYFMARVCAYLAEVALWEGELDQAEQWLGQSLASRAEPQEFTIYQVERLYTAARLATAQQHYQRAATLFGLAEQFSSQIHYELVGPLRALVDTALVTVRTALDTEIFDDAFTLGQQLSLEEASTTILAPARLTNTDTSSAPNSSIPSAGILK